MTRLDESLVNRGTAHLASDMGLLGGNESSVMKDCIWRKREAVSVGQATLPKLRMPRHDGLGHRHSHFGITSIDNSEVAS